VSGANSLVRSHAEYVVFEVLTDGFCCDVPGSGVAVVSNGRVLGYIDHAGSDSVAL
jgi:hypothetical protein